MDIIKEINRLPNYIYELNTSPYWMVFGGHSCPTETQYNSGLFQRAIDEYAKLCTLYYKEEKDDKDKKEIARLARRISGLCEFRIESCHSLKQQSEFINQLSSEEKNEIIKQIEMYKTAREYYRDYIHNK